MILLERYDERILVFTKESACGTTKLKMSKVMSSYSVQLIYLAQSNGYIPSSGVDLALK